MTQQQAVAKDQLVQALRSSEQQFADAVAAVNPADLELGCYENGWNARQVLAHVASIEWTYAGILDLARGGGTSAPAPKTQDRPASGSGTSYSAPPASGAILSYNDRQVEKRAGASVADLLAEFRENRAKTIAAVEAADDTTLAVEVRSAGGLKGPAATVIQGVAVAHVLVHLNDILNAVKQP